MTDTEMINWLAENQKFPLPDEIAALVVDNVERFKDVHGHQPDTENVRNIYRHIFRWWINQQNVEGK